MLDEPLLKKRPDLTDEFIAEKRFDFLDKPIKGKANSEIEMQHICHHCQWIGPQQYFYNCTQRIVLINTNPEEDLYRYLFNMKNGLSKTCDKKFCLYCVKNCYHTISKKNDNKMWSCVFCSNSCYCSTCNNRDLYIRLYEIYTKLGGKVEEIQNNSLIEKIIGQNTKRSKPVVEKIEDQMPELDSVDNLPMNPFSLKLIEQYKNMNCELESQSDLNFLIRKRKLLIKLYEISKSIVKREELKLESIKLMFE